MEKRNNSGKAGFPLKFPYPFLIKKYKGLPGSYIFSYKKSREKNKITKLIFELIKRVIKKIKKNWSFIRVFHFLGGVTIVLEIVLKEFQRKRTTYKV